MVYTYAHARDECFVEVTMVTAGSNKSALHLCSAACAWRRQVMVEGGGEVAVVGEGEQDEVSVRHVPIPKVCEMFL